MATHALYLSSARSLALLLAVARDLEFREESATRGGEEVTDAAQKHSTGRCESRDPVGYPALLPQQTETHCPHPGSDHHGSPPRGPLQPADGTTRRPPRLGQRCRPGENNGHREESHRAGRRSLLLRYGLSRPADSQRHAV